MQAVAQLWRERRRARPLLAAFAGVALLVAGAGTSAALGLDVPVLSAVLHDGAGDRARGARVDGFKISGRLRPRLYPGVSRRLNLVFTNSNPFPITVVRVRIAIARQSSKPGCPAGANLRVTRPLRGRVRVPARTRASLLRLHVRRSRWPRLTMPALPVNQDACQRAVFRLRYRGVARR